MSFRPAEEAHAIDWVRSIHFDQPPVFGDSPRASSCDSCLHLRMLRVKHMSHAWHQSRNFCVRFLSRATSRLCDRKEGGGFTGKRGSMQASQAYPGTFGRAVSRQLWSLGDVGIRQHLLSILCHSLAPTEVALLLTLRRTVSPHVLTASLHDRLGTVLTTLVHEAD